MPHAVYFAIREEPIKKSFYGLMVESAIVPLEIQVRVLVGVSFKLGSSMAERRFHDPKAKDQYFPWLIFLVFGFLASCFLFLIRSLSAPISMSPFCSKILLAVLSENVYQDSKPKKYHYLQPYLSHFIYKCLQNLDKNELQRSANPEYRQPEHDHQFYLSDKYHFQKYYERD